MASLAGRTAHTASRSWCNALAGMSRSLEGSLSSRVLQHRSYSEEGLDGHAPLTPEISSAAELAVDAPLPVDAPQRAPVGADRYPPRNFLSPRGVYKAILLGEVGQAPIQKILKSGRAVTIFSVGTGGMYNNRRPFEGETPENFAERSYTQWHRVAVYQDRVSSMVMQRVKVGSQVYLEGNIETRVYNDPNSGIVKRIREIAIRAHGRLMFMDTPASKVPAESPPGSVPPAAPPSGN